MNGQTTVATHANWPSTRTPWLVADEPPPLRRKLLPKHKAPPKQKRERFTAGGHRTGPPPAEAPSDRCKQCKQRFAQERGLCRRCQRENGYLSPNRQAQPRLAFPIQGERAAIAERDAREAKWVAQQADTKQIVVDGVTYDIVYDGRVK